MSVTTLKKQDHGLDERAPQVRSLELAASQISPASKEVTIVQYCITHYRLNFYEELKRILREQDINLRLLYSGPPTDPKRGNLVKHLYDDVVWGEKIPVQLLPKRLIWQPYIKATQTSDLVIVEHAIKQILSYHSFLMPMLGRPKLAFWGHGWDHQKSDISKGHEPFKIWLGKQAHWYFAYTEKVKERLIGDMGYNPDRITAVENAVTPPVKNVDDVYRDQLRRELNLDDDARVAIFCGKIYALKQIDLLLEAAQKVHERVPRFRLIIAGAGEEEEKAVRAARENDYISFVGPVRDEKKAALFSLGHVVAMSGLVGLGVVDAFHFGLPPVAPHFPFHSPEFGYLDNEKNAIVTENTADSFADGLVRLLTDEPFRQRLADACSDRAKTLTVENMAKRFAGGINSALQTL